MNNTKLLMIGMKPKDSIKLDIVVSDKPETYSEENVLLEDGLYKYLYQPVEQHGNQKCRLQTLSGVKTHRG